MNASDYYIKRLDLFTMKAGGLGYAIRRDAPTMLCVQRVVKAPSNYLNGIGLLATITAPYYGTSLRIDVGPCWISPAYGAAPWTSMSGALWSWIVAGHAISRDEFDTMQLSMGELVVLLTEAFSDAQFADHFPKIADWWLKVEAARALNAPTSYIATATTV